MTPRLRTVAERHSVVRQRIECDCSLGLQCCLQGDGGAEKLVTLWHGEG